MSVNRLNSRNKSAFFLAIEPLLLFAVFYLPGYLQQSGESVPALFSRLDFNLIYMATVLPQMLLLLYVLQLKPGRSIGDFRIGRIKAIDLPLAFLGTLGFFLCTLLAALLFSQFSSETLETAMYHQTMVLENRALLIVICIACMCTGYSEELFFRSYCIGFFRRQGLPLLPVVLISSILFGLGHLYQGVFGFLATSLMGLFASLFYLWRGSLHSIAIGHGLYNFILLLISLG